MMKFLSWVFYPILFLIGYGIAWYRQQGKLLKRRLELNEQRREYMRLYEKYQASKKKLDFIKRNLNLIKKIFRIRR